MARRLPDVFYNWISVIGALIATFFFGVIVLLMLIDILVQETTLYLGMLTFMVLPSFLVLGLVLIPLGALWERHRRERGVVSAFPHEIHFDLKNPGHRNAALIWTLGTAFFLLGTAVGTYKAYQATESVAFCGELCHSVMSPEYIAYQISPHARVSCAECHIGSGAEWFVKAKISGLYQVYATLAENFPTPIPTPIENLRPARETCEHCHWPDKFYGARKDVLPHFLADEENTPYPISLMLNIGGGGAKGEAEGIHWHVARTHHMEYIARDHDREEIIWVRLTDHDGQVVEYTIGGEPLSEKDRAHPTRSVDCMDCHNRPSHKYLSPIRAVNQAMHQGEIDVTLPYIKRETVTALDREYKDTPGALQAIEARLTRFYREEYSELLEQKPDVVRQAVQATQAIYQQNFFPEMKVSWKAYPDQIGHSEFIGCFRCHGSELETADGKPIRKDCSLCHVILSQGTKAAGGSISPDGERFEHPIDIDGAEFEGNCTECHEGGAEQY